MFQPNRPPVRWSSVDIRRANGSGASCERLTVTAKARCSVAIAIGGITSSGSFTGTCTASRSAVSGLAIDVINPDHIGQEKPVELAPLQEARQFDPMLHPPVF